jgi:heme exporter protein C
MLRAVQSDPLQRARTAAIIGIIGFVDLPIVHYSVTWWRSLHQGPTFPLLQDPKLDDRMEVALFVNMLGFILAFLFLLGQRLRLAGLEGERDRMMWEEAQRV